jgi:hypothetical protein
MKSGGRIGWVVQGGRKGYCNRHTELVCNTPNATQKAQKDGMYSRGTAGHDGKITRTAVGNDADTCVVEESSLAKGVENAV